MAESEMFQKGLEVRRAVLGADYVDGSIAKADDFMMAFQRIGDSGYEGPYASLDPEDEFSSDDDDGLYVRPEAPRSGFDVWFRDPEKPEVTNGPNYGVTANRLLMSRPA